MKTTSIVLLFGLLVCSVSCNSQGSQRPETGTAQKTVKSTLSVDEFQQKLSATANAQLVDVRTPEEFAGGHLANAINIDIRSQDFADKISKLNKSKPVFVYCLSGGRSSSAAGTMADMGFAAVYNMDGGIMKWSSAGKLLANGNASINSTGLSAEDFKKMVSQNKYVLVDYNATWCAPCKKLAPILESVANKRKDKLSLVKIDADANKELLKQKSISSIPFLELYHDGVLEWTHNGFIEEDQLLKETKL